MKYVRCFTDLRAFGLDCLTGEACGLNYRVLFDLTAKGKKIVEKCLDVKIESEPWNRGSKDDPHVASIMLSHEMIVPIGIFALLESGCSEVWMLKDGALAGFDGHEHDDNYRAVLAEERQRRFAYQGTAGSRNQHVFSGRVE